MAINSIAEYLKKITGLDSCSVGIAVVEQAVAKRMLACKANTHFEYYNVLTSSNSELCSLIDQVMIPETWFFRGQETFNYLKVYLTARAINTGLSKVRILTVPCATGEEPYSIAITLTECGYNPNQYVIDAVDIAQESLRMAKEAVFTDHSFRDENDLIKQRYFSKTEDGFKLDNLIAEKINFSCGNIFDLKIEGENRYDVVFCRNLLIYFDKDTQRKALEKIETLMTDDGILFIGHGEAGCIINSQFTKINVPNAFAFTKSINKQKQSHTRIRYDNRKILSDKAAKEQSCNAKPNKCNVESKKTGKADNDYFGEAARLADEGKFDAAMEKCKQSINEKGASADALCLLGIIHDAIGDRVAAVNYYNRALNLMPEHYQSLMHLASHAERSGDTLKASQYRMKAIQVKKEPT